MVMQRANSLADSDVLVASACVCLTFHHAHTLSHIYTYTYIMQHARLYLCIYVYAHICVLFYLHRYIDLQTHVCLHAWRAIPSRLYAQSYTHTHTYAYIYSNIYIYIHTSVVACRSAFATCMKNCRQASAYLIRNIRVCIVKNTLSTITFFNADVSLCFRLVSACRRPALKGEICESVISN